MVRHLRRNMPQHRASGVNATLRKKERKQLQVVVSAPTVETQCKTGVPVPIASDKARLLANGGTTFA